MGPDVEEGSILLKEMPPTSVLTNEHGGATLMLYESLKLCCGTLLSLMVTVKLKVPDKTGVPEISAVSDGDGDGVKIRPGGRLPVMDQEYGVLPFNPVSVTVYGVLTTPFGRLFGDMFSGDTASASTAMPTSMTSRTRAVKLFLENLGPISLSRKCLIIVKNAALCKLIIASKGLRSPREKLSFSS
jgi:hypothetical protein